MKKIIDGNTACSNTSYLFTEIASIYPITPSSPMASNVDKLTSTSKTNIFNNKVNVVEMQSEGGAAGAFHGALINGNLATTYTASQGLLLMLPNMYKVAGEMLPGVIHVASRTIATHALSIFGDHSDIYSALGTGFCMLASSNVEDASFLAAVAHLSAIKSSLPFLHFFDGFRTSHEINTIEEIEDDKLKQLVDQEALKRFQNKALGINKFQRGMAENEDIYFQSMEARNKDYEILPDIVNEYMIEINKLTNKEYKPFTYYGHKDATHIIIAMGSVNDTIKLVIDHEQNQKIGLIEVHLYRPFSIKYLLEALPASVKTIAVLDRAKQPGSIGEPLYLDIVSALKDKDIEIVGGRYGLSSKNTTPAHIMSVYKMLQENPQNNFTIGINDDVTNKSLEKTDYKLELDAKEILVYGFGSDGMVSASKSILKLIHEQTKEYVQGYFEYDSKKSGGVTVSNLRISNKKINAPYYVEKAGLIVVTKDEYLSQYPMIKNIKENGILLVNTKDENEFFEKITASDLDLLIKKNITVQIINADMIAQENGIKGKISKIMEFLMLNILGIENSFDIISESIKKSFATKGEDIVNNNIKALTHAKQEMKTIVLANTKEALIQDKKSIFEKINARLGNDLSVKELMPFKEGIFPGELTKKEKRNISSIVAKWIPENCIQCGMCSFVCPHAVIRSIASKDELGIPFMGKPEYYYYIAVSEFDCTGCGLCVNVCPGKMGKKALVLDELDQKNQDIADQYFNNHINDELVPDSLIKGSQLKKPRFEFHGACAGCGETAYIKLLTQLYQDELIIANATGCTSIYGGSAPSTPYSIPWANSLFEDNAEFGFGMYLAYNQKRNQIETIMLETMNEVKPEVKEQYTKWLENKSNHKITTEVQQALVNIDMPLKELIEFIPYKEIWCVGGDGWAYDIGFGGIDHVLSTNEKIKMLVLDTEVYSNTGGQMSKSSHQGQIAEFANFGKRATKKDLFRIAMAYPNCYVASICHGANMLHTLKVLKEAKEHDGPVIIIAYSTCIEHGIKGGMSCSLSEQKLAVECGYALLMRYKDKTLHLDSKEPDFSKYQDFLMNEVRYHSLRLKDESLADELLKRNENDAKARYEFYKNQVK